MSTLAIQSKVLAAMKPGREYTVNDIVTLSKGKMPAWFAARDALTTLQTLKRRGFVKCERYGQFTFFKRVEK